MNLWYFISGDWPFFFLEEIQAFSWFPQIWDGAHGFGQYVVHRLWIDYPFRVVVKLLASLGLSWFIIDKLFIVIIVLLALWSSYSLGIRVFGKRTLRFVVPGIYLGNTYFFMIFGGGQLGVSLAYAVFPFVLLRFMDLFDDPSFSRSIKFWLVFAILGACDLRFAYMVCILLLVYSLVFFQKVFRALFYIVLAGIISFIFHLYWIWPAISLRSISLPSEFTSLSSLSFFSVADFSHAFSLLHPNWPENLFGRVYFLRPEFLVFPLIAYASLIKLPSKQRMVFLFFGLVGILGTFLAKGVQDPLGGVYQWLFDHIPGFVMFRDSTKWYMFIALSYAVLIPQGFSILYQEVKQRLVCNEVAMRLCFVLVGIALLFLFVRPVLEGKTFRNFFFHAVPDEYVQLKDQLLGDDQFSRILWLPVTPKFAYCDTTHPCLNTDDLFGESSISGILRFFQSKESSSVLTKNSIGYVAVATDITKTIYLNDYQYDDTLRKSVVTAIDGARGNMYKLNSFTDLAVYQIDAK